MFELQIIWNFIKFTFFAITITIALAIVIGNYFYKNK